MLRCPLASPASPHLYLRHETPSPEHHTRQRLFYLRNYVVTSAPPRPLSPRTYVATTTTSTSPGPVHPHGYHNTLHLWTNVATTPHLLYLLTFVATRPSLRLLYIAQTHQAVLLPPTSPTLCRGVGSQGASPTTSSRGGRRGESPAAPLLGLGHPATYHLHHR